VTQGLTDAVRHLAPILRNAVLIREAAMTADEMDNDTGRALDDLMAQQVATTDLVRLIGSEEATKGLLLIDAMLGREPADEVEELREELALTKTAIRIACGGLEMFGADDRPSADPTPGDEYPDREILGVVIPGALAEEGDRIILKLVELRMALEPIVREAEAHAAKVDALGSEVLASMRDAVTDVGAPLDGAEDGIHFLIGELTEGRRVGNVARNLADLITEANL
jgi:hypothetical protein